MDSRLLTSVIMIGFAAVTAGVGLFAYFSDTATSTNNLFEAGTIDLTLNDQQSIGAFISGTNMRPGDTYSGSVVLRNTGTLTGSALDLDAGLAVSESLPGYGYGYGYGSGVGTLAKYLRISSLTYGGSAITIPDVNWNGYPDLNDWDQDNVHTRDLAEPGSGKTLALTVVFDASAPNAVQGVRADVTFTFYLAQVAASDLAS